MPNFAGIQTVKNELIRKALGGSLFGAPYSATAITSLTGSDKSLTALPTGWSDFGRMTDDGMQFSREVETSDVTSFGAYEPTRSDVTSDVLNLEVALQETNIRTISLFTGKPQSALVPSPTTGELQIDKPARPAPRYYRLLALAVDEIDEGEIYIARSLPRAKVTDYADQAFAKGDDALGWGVTFQAQTDSTLGYSQRDIFGGPGWFALLTKMGFPTA